MSEILQWAMGALVIAGFAVLWRIDAASRASKRLQREARTNVAAQARAVDQLRKYAADWGHLNEKRAAINTRYDDTVTKIREKFGIEDVA